MDTSVIPLSASVAWDRSWMPSVARNRRVVVPTSGVTATSWRKPREPNVSEGGVLSLGSGLLTSGPGQAHRTRAAVATSAVVMCGFIVPFHEGDAHGR